jgi:TonB family protein
MHVKPLGCLIALSFASFLAQAPPAEEPSVPAKPAAPWMQCGVVEYPLEAVSYVLEGKTQLEFSLGADGRPLDIVVKQSSGRQTLDRYTVELFEGCKTTKLPVQDTTARHRIEYVWSLDTPPGRRILVPGSCAPSERFAGFRAFDRTPSGPDGILVRSLVRPEGKPQYTRAERGTAPADLAAEAIAYLQSCKFELGPGPADSRDKTVFGRVLLK